jgi:hypothetical protein
MNCKKGAIKLIDSIVDTISAIDVDQYHQPLKIYNGSTFGKHFRHIHDFFHCLVHQCPDHEIDYCHRCREERIENEKNYSIEAFRSLQQELEGLDEDQMITVKADFEVSAGVRPTVRTSIGREIMYAYDHAVHHLAIVKIGLNAHCPDLELDQDIGVAASTIRHQTSH